MRVKKQPDGVSQTFIYTRKKGEDESQAILRTALECSKKIKGIVPYLEYNYWRYTDAKKHYESEVKKVSQSIDFCTIPDVRGKIIESGYDNFLIFLGLPKTFREFIRNGSEFHTVYIYDSYPEFIDVVIGIDKYDKPSLIIRRRSYSKKGKYDVSDLRYDLSNDGYQEMINSITKSKELNKFL